METYEEIIEALDRLPRKQLQKVYKYLSQMRLWRDADVRGTSKGDFEEYVRVMNEIVGRDVREKSKCRDVVWGRFVVIHRLAMEGLPLTYIGRLFGIRHCSVIYARDSVDRLLASPRFFPYEMSVYSEFYKRINKEQGQPPTNEFVGLSRGQRSGDKAQVDQPE